MKKILIASAFAFTLCLTSCASDKAPETEDQVEAPQTESPDETAEQNDSEDNTSSDTESEAENTEDSESSDIPEVLTSEDFPEPEEIDEQEIITLEPQEEIQDEEIPAPVEPVEKEEPPEIKEISEPTEPQESQEPQAQSQPEEKEPEPSISANDVIIDSTQDSDGISGGIDITDETEDSTDNNDPEKEIIPSRSVTLKKFEYLDVTYPGSGWIYMGLTDNSKDIAYFGRKLGTKDTKFSLQARAAGRKIIHFYRNDPLTGQYLDDYIEVIISAENGSNKTHVAAPDYKLPVQKKEKPVKMAEETSEELNKTTPEVTTPSAAAASVPAATPQTSTKPDVKSEEPAKKQEAAKPVSDVSSKSIPEPQVPAPTVTETAVPSQTSANPDSLLQEAQLLYNEKEYKTALSKLNQYFEYSTDNRDEALYLKGQILEAKSDVRDIKGAIDAYTTLTKNYPASKLWDSANKRIIYLKRFYLEVR